MADPKQEAPPYILQGTSAWTTEQGEPDPYSDKARAIIDVGGKTKHVRIGDYLPGGGAITRIGPQEIWAIPDDPDGGPEYRVGLSPPKPKSKSMSLREETLAKAKELMAEYNKTEGMNYLRGGQAAAMAETMRDAFDDSMTSRFPEELNDEQPEAGAERKPEGFPAYGEESWGDLLGGGSPDAAKVLQGRAETWAEKLAEDFPEEGQ